MNKLLLCVALIVTGCATTAGSLQSKSARLENQSRELYAEIRQQMRQPINDPRDDRRSTVSRAAEALIISSRDLNRAIESRSTNDRVLNEYDRVARDYKQLHDSLAADGYADQNRTVLAEFDKVTEAYLAIEHSLGSRNARIGQVEQPKAPKAVASANVGRSESEHNEAALRDAAVNAELDRRARLKSYWFP